MVKHSLAAVALAALAACGGGGGGGGAPMMLPAAAPAPTQEAPPKPVDPILQVPSLTYPGCFQAAENHVACDLVPSETLIGAAVPAGQFASFTNRTGVPLQIIDAGAITLERSHWSEWCMYLGQIEDLTTVQREPGKGEVGCATKDPGEDYAPMTWGAGIVVEPGEMVMLNSHTIPGPINHTYTLRVQYQANGGKALRQPRADRVIDCDGQTQYTDMVPWKNDTGRDVVLSGASIYAEIPGTSTPHTVANACIYVYLTPDGLPKYSNCDVALRTRGVVTFPPVTVAPGEYIAAQAINACTGGHWNWAAWLNVR